MPASWPSPGFGGGNLPDGVPPGTEIGFLGDGGRRRSDIDSGPPMTASKSTAVPKTLRATWTGQLAAAASDIMTFYETTLLNGSQPFDWELPYAPGVTVSFKFDEPPTVIFDDLGGDSADGGAWVIGVSLLTVP